MDERKTKKRPEKREASVKQFPLVSFCCPLIPEHSILTLPLVYLIQKNGSLCDFKSNNDVPRESVSDTPKTNDNNFCKYTSPVKLFTVWQIAYFTYAYAIPALILIVAYSKILLHLKVNKALEDALSARMRTPDSPRTPRNSIPKQNRKKITSLIQTLVASYLICYSPYSGIRITRELRNSRFA